MSIETDEVAVLEKPARARWTFRVKLTVLAVSLALIPVAIVGLVSMNVNKKALSEANKDLLYSVLHHIVRHAEEGLRRDQDELSIAAAALMDTSQDIEQRLALVRALVGGGRLEAIAVYDQTGARIDVVAPVATGDAPKLEFPETLEQADRLRVSEANVAIGDVFVSPKDGSLRVFLIARATGPSAEWYLASYFDLEKLQSELESIGQERMGRGHSLFVVDPELRVLADSQIESRGITMNRDDLGILSGVDPAIFKQGILVFGETSTSDRSMLGAIRSLESVPWAVVAEIPRDVAYHSLTQIRFILWLVVGIASLIALSVAVFMARRISAPLQMLVSFAGDLANRRFDKRVAVHTRDELSVLGQALSSAAIELEASDLRIRKEERIRSDLGRYLPHTLVDRIVEQQQELRLGGDRCQVTVLFADVVGFTPLVESHSADEVVNLLNDLFTILTEIIFRHGGTVDKFIGDSVMAFWGAPNPVDNHAELALRAAEDMMRWLEVGNAGWKQKYGIEIRLAIGVNTGEAVVGNFGSKERMEYTAIGDCVNVAARLETIARPQQVLITAATKDAAGDQFDYVPLGSRHVVGRRASVELFEVVV
tara:strand:+ start:45579 stop:47369 length:1791 start_codon:yes stop_codon:yes gene_type:complete